MRLRPTPALPQDQADAILQRLNENIGTIQLLKAVRRLPAAKSSKQPTGPR